MNWYPAAFSVRCWRLPNSRLLVVDVWIRNTRRKRNIPDRPFKSYEEGPIRNPLGRLRSKRIATEYNLRVYPLAGCGTFINMPRFGLAEIYIAGDYR